MKFLLSILFWLTVFFSVNGFAQTLTIAPNPFVQTTTIGFTLSTSDTTSLYIANILGNTVKTILRDTVLSPAQYSYMLSGDSLSAGSYVVVLQRNGQRINKRLIKASNATAITEIKSTSNWDLYPNPAKDKIMFDSAFIGSEIVVMDVSGREHTVSIDQTQIDISSLAKGPHIVRFKCKGVVVEKKFIKE